MVFLSAERLRRFDQLVKNLCSDIERGLITVRTDGIGSLCESVNDLQRLSHTCGQFVRLLVGLQACPGSWNRPVSNEP